MKLSDRSEAFARTFPKWPAAHLRMVEERERQVLYGIWVLGNDYRTRSTFYGAYPHGYLPRVMALFPDVGAGATLHVFSGSLPPGPYTRCDLRQDAELRCSVYDLPERATVFYRLILADPPYSADDASEYDTPMVDRRRAMAALARVTAPGGHLVWLDTCWPMHRKDEWATVGRILLQRSTNHRARVVSIFERLAA